MHWKYNCIDNWKYPLKYDKTMIIAYHNLVQVGNEDWHLGIQEIPYN